MSTVTQAESTRSGSDTPPTSTRKARNVASQTKPLLICFSHLRWDFVWQRPQHLLTRAAERYDVVFVEEPVVEAGPAPRMTLSRRPQNVTVAVPCLPEGLGYDAQVTAQRDLVDEFLASRKHRAVVFWYYTPMAVAFTADLDRDLTIYDNMDELSAFRGASPALLAMEELLLRQADLVFTGGVSLYEAKRGRHANVHAFPSSIDVEHFVRARPIRDGRASDGGIASPRLGFFGVIDERFDPELVDGIAALRPEWQFDMVGPVVKIDPAHLPSRPNINWLGPCPYDDLPDRLASWDIGIMPFALNEATRFISPTKTPEFLAAGLPVVSTAIVDVVRSYGRLGLVEVGETADAFVAAVECLLARPVQPWLESVDRQLATGSWAATWAAMHSLMLDGMTASVTPAPRQSWAPAWPAPAISSGMQPGATGAGLTDV